MQCLHTPPLSQDSVEASKAEDMCKNRNRLVEPHTYHVYKQLSRPPSQQSPD